MKVNILTHSRFRKLSETIASEDETAFDDALAGYLFSFESAQAPHEFIGLVPFLKPTRFWRGFHAHWNGFDRIPHTRFAKLLRRFKPHWKLEYMQPDDAASYDALPERLTAYRGQDSAARAGLSWTLDRSIAEGFALGHRGLFNPSPIVWEATVLKSEIAGFYTERGEAELVLFSAAAARRRVVHNLEPRSLP